MPFTAKQLASAKRAAAAERAAAVRASNRFEAFMVKAEKAAKS